MRCTRTVGLAVAVVVLAGCGAKSGRREPATAGNPGQPAASRAAPKDLLSLRTAMHDARRLPPDSRYLRAIGDVWTMLTGEPGAPAEARRGTGSWSVVFHGRPVATVPDDAPFPVLLGSLRRWAAQIASERGLEPSRPQATPPAAEPASVDPQALFETLAMVDAARVGNRRSAQTMVRGARALAALCLEIPPEGPAGDAVMARALAALAVAQELGRAGMPRAEILVAQVMGYGAHATRLGDSLPGDDPLRLYLDRRETELERAALDARSPGQTSLLALRLAAEQHRMDSFEKIAATCFGDLRGAILPVVVTGLRLRLFDTDLAMGRATVSTILDDLARMGPERPGRQAVATIQSILRTVGMDRAAAALEATAPTNVFERFNAGLAALDLPASGGYHDRALVSAFYRDCLDGAVFAMARFYLRSLSSVPGAKALAVSLAQGATGPPDPVVLWLRHVADVKGGGSPEVLLDDLRHLHGLSPRMRTWELDDFLHAEPYGSPKVFEAGRALLSGLDARPRARLTLGWVAGAALEDLNLAERADASGAAASGRRTLWPMLRYARLVGDGAVLRQVVADPASPPWAGLRAAQYLHDIGAAGASETISLLRGLVKRHPDHLDTTLELARMLEEQHRLREAERVLRTWLQNHRDPDLAHVEATVHLCEVLRKRGRLAEALREIEPAAESWKRSALVMQAELLDAAGSADEAERVARQTVERYPDVMDALREEVVLLWRHRRLDAAAGLLAHPPHAITAEHWRWTLGPEFATAFRDELALGIDATEAMIRAGVRPVDVESLAQEVNQRGNPRLAFEMVSRLRPPQPLYRVQIAVEGYDYLKAYRGAAAATSWLREQVPAQLLNPLSQFAFQERTLELLWDPVPAEPRGTGADWVWLFRAAAIALDPETLEPHRAGVVRYLDHAPATRVTAITRHLLGQLPAGKLIPLAHRPKELCETAYYLGLRAQCDGDFHRAADWYAVAVTIGRPSWGEHRWAFNQIHVWYNTGKSLDRLASQGG